MKKEDLKKGQSYRFIASNDIIVYIGDDGFWLQFEKFGISGVWCELLEKDLHLLEEFN